MFQMRLKATLAKNLTISVFFAGWAASPQGSDVQGTHHSSQAMFLHQPEGVLVAGSEVIGLGGAHMIPGHRAHGVDDICRAREKTHGSVSATVDFQAKVAQKPKFASR